MRLHIFLVGLLSIVVQVVLLRELSAAFYGVDLIYLLALGAWLLWTAIGAFIAGGPRAEARGLRASENARGNRTGAWRLWFAAVGVVVPLDVVLIRRLQGFLGGVPGAYLPLPTQIGASVLCLLPPALLLGVLFQRAATRYLAARRDASLARAYAIESLGGLVGGGTVTLALHVPVSSVLLALVTSGLAFVAALVPVPSPKVRESESPRVDVPTFGLSDSRTSGLPDFRTLGLPDFRTWASAAGLIACLIAGLNAAALDRWTTSWNHPAVVESLDSPYARVTIEERAGQVSVYENGALTLDSQGTAAEEFAHLSLLQHPAPGRILLLGGAAAGLLDAAVQHGAERIDGVELDRHVIESLERRLGTRVAGLRSSQAVRIVFDDPRRFVSRSGDQYDVIVLAASEPASAQANRLFTREFFAACAARLRRAGILSLRLPSIENAWTPPLVARTGAIHAALREVFADVVVLPGSSNIVLASATPLVRDPRVLADRFVARGIRARLVSPRYIRYLYLNDRYEEIRSLLARPSIAPNTDANPASYRATTMLWLSKFVPSAARLDLEWAGDAFGPRSPGSWAAAAIAVLAALVWRRRRWPRRTVVVASAACAGMLLETVLLLQYQLKQGVMFRDLGLLLMAVMAGLAAGAWIADRGAGWRRGVRSAMAWLGVMVLLAGATALVTTTGYASGALSIALMLFTTGAAISGVFACVSFDATAMVIAGAPVAQPRDDRRTVSSLYGADVLGGCLGSVVASLLMIPLFGLPLTAGWAGLLAAVALMLA